MTDFFAENWTKNTELSWLLLATNMQPDEAIINVEST